MRSFLLSVFLIAAFILMPTHGAFASIPPPGSGGSSPPSKTADAGDCGGGYVELSVPIEDSDDAGDEPDNCVLKGNDSANPIYIYLRMIVRWLSAGVGITVVIMIILSGIQYITSAGKDDATAAAKKRLGSAVLALILFIFMAAILNFVIPGGLL
ncbi:hypothetical protein HY346_03065 [Candidatus Microgenomates bacterium]|nr:hypothetical protein [Candidatus Microgenomates bacterium]